LLAKCRSSEARRSAFIWPKPFWVLFGLAKSTGDPRDSSRSYIRRHLAIEYCCFIIHDLWLMIYNNYNVFVVYSKKIAFLYPVFQKQALLV